MDLLLRLSSVLPREIVSEVFFRIRPPTEDDFLTACKEGKNLLLLEHWLSFGLVDVSIRDNEPIKLAVICGHLHVISLLLDHGADASSPFFLAVMCHLLTIISLLFAHGAESTNEALHWAKWSGNSDMVYLLRSKRMRVD